jgi:hypothetical protein
MIKTSLRLLSMSMNIAQTMPTQANRPQANKPNNITIPLFCIFSYVIKKSAEAP